MAQQQLSFAGLSNRTEIMYQIIDSMKVHAVGTSETIQNEIRR